MTWLATKMLTQEKPMTKAKYDPPPEKRECRYCNTFFKPVRESHIYCSQQCKKRYARMLKALQYAEANHRGSR